MIRAFLMIVLLAVSSTAFATGSNCSKCSNGGNTGSSSNSNANANAAATAVSVVSTDVDVSVRNTNSQHQGQVQSQSQTATGGNASATVGDVTATGGDSVAAAVVESGAVDVNYSYREVEQAPAIGQGSFAIQGCAVAGNAGGSWDGGAAFLGFGWTPAQCYDFMLAQAYQSLGEKKAACDILATTKAGKRAAKNGVALPGCEPKLKTKVVPVVAPAPDLSQYATKEELNRAFKASQQSK